MATDPQETPQGAAQNQRGTPGASVPPVPVPHRTAAAGHMAGLAPAPVNRRKSGKDNGIVLAHHGIVPISNDAPCCTGRDDAA